MVGCLMLCIGAMYYIVCLSHSVLEMYPFKVVS